MSTPGEMLREARARFSGAGESATRVYRGRSVDELVPQIQRELGDEAIIVRRREGLTGGVLGFFQRAFVEIEAMPGGLGVDVYDEDAPTGGEHIAATGEPASTFDDAAAFEDRSALNRSGSEQSPVTSLPPLDDGPFEPDPPPAPPASFAPHAPPAPADERAPYRQQPPAPPAPPGLGYAPRPSTGPAPAPPAAPTPPVSSAPSPVPGSAPGRVDLPFNAREPYAPPAGAGSAYVTAHLAALARADRAKAQRRPSTYERRGARVELGTGLPDPGTGRELRATDAPAPFAAGAAPAQAWDASERREVAPGSQGRARAGVARSLQRCGIGEELTRELIDAASAHALALAPRAGLAQAVRATLAQRIPVAPPLPAAGAAIVVVGAGGSGKTTCCAALLGAYRKGSSVTASFATISREPDRGELQMILSPHIVKPSSARAPRALRALRRAREEGMTILDTPSLSPSDRAGIRELARLLTELSPERVLVALPATLGATAAAQLLQALKPLGANALAVTHADETDQLGVAVEAACRFGLAPEYMLERGRTGGWRLRQIAPSALAEMLLP